MLILVLLCHSRRLQLQSPAMRPPVVVVVFTVAAWGWNLSDGKTVPHPTTTVRLADSECSMSASNFRCHTAPELSRVFLQPRSSTWCVVLVSRDDRCLALLNSDNGSERDQLKTQNCTGGEGIVDLYVHLDTSVWKNLNRLLNENALSDWLTQSVPNTVGELYHICISKDMRLTQTCSVKRPLQTMASTHRKNTTIFIQVCPGFQYIQVSMELVGCFSEDNDIITRGNYFITEKDFQRSITSESWFRLSLLYTPVDNTHAYHLRIGTIRHGSVINTSETCGQFRGYRLQTGNGSSLWQDKCGLATTGSQTGSLEGGKVLPEACLPRGPAMSTRTCVQMFWMLVVTVSATCFTIILGCYGFVLAARGQ